MLDDKALRKKVQSVAEVKSQLHKVLDKVQANRGKRPQVGYLPKFAVGEYLLAAGVRRSGSTPKLLMTWTGPWRVVVAQRPHVYGVQNIVSGEVRDVHVVRMRFYADAAIAITAELKEVFQHAFTQGEVEISTIVDTANAENGSGFEAEIEWVGFDKRRIRGIAKIWDAAPQFVKSELCKLGLKRGVRTQLKQQYAITL